MSKTKIYALFTAINDYAHIRGLNGCINDANNIFQYIKEATKAQNQEFFPKKLYNADATKEEIVKHFIQHLGQATENDICLFYFSGHGGQETAHPAFDRHEPDNKLEVLACYDSKMSKQGSFLADKELRHILHHLYQKTKAQIVTIFDCCHSGTISKNKQLVLRRLMNDAKGRNWEDFIFANQITEDSVAKATSLESVMPKGKHIQLAACENKQSAYEVGGKGVFTTNLVELLKQTKGNINYRNLMSILQLKIKGSYKQTPQYEATGGEQLLFQSFLGGLTQHQKHTVNIVYNSRYRSWMMNMGAIHGIEAHNPKLCIEVLNDTGHPIEKASITKVLTHYTKLSFRKDTPLNRQLAYKVNLAGLMVKKMNIFLVGDEVGTSLFERYVQENPNQTTFLEIVDKPANADYFVVAFDKTYAIHQPSNEHPLTATIKKYHHNSLELLTEYLQHIARWKFTQQLSNPSTQITPNPPIDIHIYASQENGTDQELPIKKGQVVANYTSIPPSKNTYEFPQVQLRIKLKNNTSKPYYCALLYLSQDFSIMPDLLAGTTVELLPNRSVQAFESQYIPDEQSNYIKHYNWQAETHYLKLIVSTQYFDVTTLLQEKLPTPQIGNKRFHVGARGFRFDKIPTFNDWTTQLIELKMPNPYFNEKEANSNLIENLKTQSHFSQVTS